MLRAVATDAPLTPSVREACGLFGVVAEAASPGRDDLAWLGNARVTLVTGPSGAGKSRLLRACVRTLLERGEPVVEAAADPDPGRAVIDQVRGGVQRRLGVLARAGLGEAVLLPRLPGDLSEGERARLRLAVAMSRCSRGAWLVCDEFCSTLDRATAQGVARTLARWAEAAGVRLLLATAHEDMAALLGAETVVRITGGKANAEPGRDATPVDLTIEDARIEDYDALAHLHYRAGRPATWALVRRATRTLPCGGRRLAGVLVVSLPTLNAAWRDRAWPGRYTGANMKARAKRLNAELRCISRVVVEPSSRGLGVARALVEDYLRRPLTPATEARAQMGAACPFFERAGMTPYPLAPSACDTRLLDAIDAGGDALVAREVERWARERKVWHALRGLDPPARARTAGAIAGARPVAYAHTASSPER